MKLRLLVPPAAAVLLAGIAPLRGQPPAPPATAEDGGTVLGTEDDRWARMTVPVNIGKSGPFAFVVDTGRADLYRRGAGARSPAWPRPSGPASQHD